LPVIVKNKLTKLADLQRDHSAATT